MSAANQNGRGRRPAGCLAALRVLVWRFALAWMLLLTGGYCVLRLIGEHSPQLALPLFAPWHLWLLPLAVSLPVLCGQWARMAALAVFLATALVWGMGLRPFAPPLAGHELLVLTYNGGDRGFAGLRRIADHHQADFILLQEANKAHAHLAARFPDYELHPVDEFALLSRWRVVDAAALYLDRGDRRLPCAARYLVERDGERLALYNVHMPTPRFILRDLLRNPLLLAGGDQRALRRHADYWRGRRMMLRELRARITADPQAVVIAGDFNMPPSGALYQRFAAGLRDAHAAGGLGFGHTFPRDRDGFGRWLQPWLRLDYVFLAGDGWRIVSCRVVDDGTPRQHLPVVAGIARASAAADSLIPAR